MRSTAERPSFGQSIAPHQLSAMAQDIVSGVGDGKPARWAGFVWYRPVGPVQEELHGRVESIERQTAA